MNEIIHQKQVYVAVGAFVFCLIFSSLFGYFGLQSHNGQWTSFSAIVFFIGILVLVIGLVYPIERNEFWFSFLLNRLGRIGWLRRFSIGQHAEGAITLSLLLTFWGCFLNVIVGAGSYVVNDLSTILFLIFTYSWIFTSTHLHCNSLNNLSRLSSIIREDEKNGFVDRIKKVSSFCNRMSLLVLFLIAIAYGFFTTFWVEAQDGTLGRLTSYAETVCNKPSFAMVYPDTKIGYFGSKLSMGLIFGFFGVVTMLILTTTILLLWLDKIHATIDIYDSDCIKPAEQLVNTFWLLAGSGLFFLPYTTALSLNFQQIGKHAVSRWLNYVSWTYIIFFTGFFFFSLVRFFIFVSKAKKVVEQQLKSELKTVLETGPNHSKLIAVQTKMKLLQDFKGRPTFTLLLQLAEIMVLVIVNIFVKIY